MSIDIGRALAKGMQAHQLVANNEVAYTFTVAQATAAGTASAACQSVLGDIGTAGRSNATALAAGISTNAANAASAGWKILYPGGIFAGPVKYEFQVANAGSATQMWNVVPFVTSQSSRIDFRIFTIPAGGGVAPSPPASTDTYSVTCIVRGWALNTGLPV